MHSETLFRKPKLKFSEFWLEIRMVPMIVKPKSQLILKNLEDVLYAVCKNKQTIPPHKYANLL